MKPNPREELIRNIILHALPPAVAPYADADRIRAIYDSAESGQTDDYFRMIAEMFQSTPDLLAALTQRQAAFIRTPWNLTTPKRATLELQRAADYLRRELETNASFGEFLPSMPRGALLPVAVGKWSVKPGVSTRWRLDRIAAAPWSLLDFAGNADRPAGTLGIKRVDDRGQWIAGDVDFPEIERGRPALGWIVHRGHALIDYPDAWGGPIRAAVMWWFFSLQIRQAWVNYCERGSYFLEGQHEANDTAGRDSLLSAFSQAQRLMAIAVSSDTQLKVHNLASSSGAAVYENFLKFASDQCVKAVLGSTMTVNASANGFGGNQGAVQADATDDVFGMDAALAARTLRAQLLQPLLRINGMNPDIVPDLTWGAQTEDQAKLADTLAKLKTAGLEPTAAALGEISERMGIALQPMGQPPGGNPALSGESVADVSLNGAQIKSLLEIAAQVAAGLLTRAGALSLISSSFPSIPPIKAAEILDGVTVQPQPRTFAASGQPARAVLLSAAHHAGSLIDRDAAARVTRAARDQFASLADSLADCADPAEASAACDSWLQMFSAAPVADALIPCCAAHAANGLIRTAAVAQLPGD